MEKKKVGLAVGLFLALVHLVWSLTVWIIPTNLQSFLDWVFKLHCLEPIFRLTAFNFVNMIFLLIVTFILGYLFGWVFAWLHNMLHKKK